FFASCSRRLQKRSTNARRVGIAEAFLPSLLSDRAYWPINGPGGSMPISHKPLYLQVRDALADLISRGTWKPGSQIPGETELAGEAGVSSGTVRKALELMESQHLIVRRQGRGSFVANPGSEALAERYAKLHDPVGRRLRHQQVEVMEFERCAG